MKKIPFFLLFVANITLFAQQSTVSGVISIHNSEFETGKREYVRNAQVEEIFQRSQATTSKDNGRFDLILIGIKPKESIELSVKKSGLEVVNKEELDIVVGQNQWVKLFMAPRGKIEENKRKYYNIGKTESEKALASKIIQKQKERKALLTDEKNNQKAIFNIESEIKKLYDKYQLIEANSRELAERFAKINLDDASEYYQKAFRYFQKGLIDSALVVLEDANFAKQVDDIILEGIRLSALEATINYNDSVLTMHHDSLVNAYMLKIELHKQLKMNNQVEIDCENLLMLGLKDTSLLLKTYQSLAWVNLIKHSYIQSEFFIQKGLAFKSNDSALQRYLIYVFVLQDKIDKAKESFILYKKSTSIIEQNFIIDIEMLNPYLTDQETKVLTNFFEKY